MTVTGADINHLRRTAGVSTGELALEANRSPRQVERVMSRPEIRRSTYLRYAEAIERIANRRLSAVLDRHRAVLERADD